MVSYSTNWMGPININWYHERGLTKIITKTLTEDCRFTSNKMGDTITLTDITERWSGGRIDVYGTGEPYGDELSLPIMHGEDYARFSVWLRTFKTETMWTLKQLVQEYEKTNPKIRWALEHFGEE
jgi:hypothetical protein